MIRPQHLKGKQVFVFGLGKAGQSTVKSLVNAQIHVVAWDDNDVSRQRIHEEFSGEYLDLQQPDAVDWSRIDFLALSPGVPLTHPTPHPIVLLAQAALVPIICDVELLYKALPDCNYVGITGTNGKSTTTVLIGHILQQAQMRCEIGGNLGIPVLDLQPLDAEGIYVLELSSYQLDLLDELTCDVSVMMNVTADHLDRHGDMDGYIKAKKRIYHHQGKEHIAVIHIDNEHTRKIYQGLVADEQIGTIIPCSCNELLDDGVSIVDQLLTVRCCGVDQQVILPAIHTLAGKHNAENMTVAIATSLSQGVALDVIVEALQSFPGLRHRLQYVREKDHMIFVNDSKATNAEAVSKALQSYENIYWIAGGVAKEGGISSLSPYYDRITYAFLIGECQDGFAEELQDNVPYILCDTLDKAVDEAVAKARESDAKAVILLSPACASFDQWSSFEARGDFFCKKVEKI